MATPSSPTGPTDGSEGSDNVSLDGDLETLADIDKRLAWSRADLAEHERLHARLERTRRQLAVVRARVGKLSARVERERADVEEFAGAGLSAFFEQIFGDLPARRDKELREWLTARLNLEQGEAELAATEADQLALEQRLAADADPREAYHRLLTEKSRWLSEHPDAIEPRQLHVAEQIGVLTDSLRELEEAHWAGHVARAALTGLLHALSKAQALGRLDMLGMAWSWGKFEHLHDAHRHASAANRALSRFQMELADVAERHEAQLNMEIGQLAAFADFVLDDIVSDWVVQCRIDRSHSSAGIARTRVNRTLRLIVSRQHTLRSELQQAQRSQQLAGRDAQSPRD